MGAKKLEFLDMKRELRHIEAAAYVTHAPTKAFIAALKAVEANK